jgi:hypothetical protein
MDDLLKLAEDAGMNKEQAETATGGVLDFLQKHVSEDQFKEIGKCLGPVEDMINKYKSEESGGSKLVGSLMGSLSGGGGGQKQQDRAAAGAAESGDNKASGAGDLAGLLASLGSMGISPADVTKFLPKVVAFLKKQNIDVADVLSMATGSTSGGGGEGGETSGQQASTGGGGNPLGKIMGMFGKK